MFQRAVIAAVLVGLAVGMVMSLAHARWIAPLIYEAEVYETKTPPAHDSAPPNADNAWQPETDAERLFFTVLVNVLTAIAYALVLIGLYGFATLRGFRIDAIRGLIWGIGGYLAVALAPALGLPPELPGAMAAELSARQIWWVATAVSTGAGLGLLAFRPTWIGGAAAIILLATPHIVGAPQPAEHGGTAPAELGRQFIVASLLLAGFFWVLLGVSTGWLFGRFIERMPSR